MSKSTDRRREMERLLSLRESAGLSLRSLSERSGIPVGTLSWWSHELRRDRSQPGFAAVRVREDLVDPLPDTPDRVPDLVVRHPDGVTVELHGHAAQQVVDRVLARIGQWC